MPYGAPTDWCAVMSTPPILTIPWFSQKNAEYLRISQPIRSLNNQYDEVNIQCKKQQWQTTNYWHESNYVQFYIFTAEQALAGFNFQSISVSEICANLQDEITW